ncbi:MAG: ribosome maturation factor RimM [Desulfobulbaceae bacterium]
MASGTAADELVLLGKVTKPHGIRGEVKMYPYSGRPENFLQYREVLLGTEQDPQRIPYGIEKARVQGKQVLLKLEGCETRAQADSLAGMQVWLRKSDLPELNEDEFYLLELEGKRVVTTGGRQLGRVAAVLETAAHDILSIRDGRREYLVPVREGLVVRLGEDEVVLDVPPGLLDINS